MKKKTDMLGGNAIKSIIVFALPIMLSSLLQYNYALVDNIIVGRYVSTDALAAVGNVGAINSFIIGAALGLTSGFTIPVAHAFGAGDRRKVAHYSGSSIVVALMVGTVIVVVAHLLSKPLLKIIGTPDEIVDLSSAYINILYFGVPFQMLSNNFTAISRAVGESKKPLYFFTISVFVNFCLDMLFVKTFGWGVEGAAAATRPQPRGSHTRSRTSRRRRSRDFTSLNSTTMLILQKMTSSSTQKPRCSKSGWAYPFQCSLP